MSSISSRVNHRGSVRKWSLTIIISRSRLATAAWWLSVEVITDDLMTSFIKPEQTLIFMIYDLPMSVYMLFASLCNMLVIAAFLLRNKLLIYPEILALLVLVNPSIEIAFQRANSDIQVLFFVFIKLAVSQWELWRMSVKTFNRSL